MRRMQVTLIAAQSLDGFITRHDEPGTAFTSPADKAHFKRVLEAFDVSVFGGETYRVSRDAIRAHLNAARCRYVVTRSPEQWSADRVQRRLEFTSLTPLELVKELREAGFENCALLGGAQLHGLFLEAGVVDRLIVTIEPQLFGAGTPFLVGRTQTDLILESHERLPGSDSLVLTYRVKKAGHSPG